MYEVVVTLPGEPTYKRQFDSLDEAMGCVKYIGAVSGASENNPPPLTLKSLTTGEEASWEWMVAYLRARPPVQPSEVIVIEHP